MNTMTKAVLDYLRSLAGNGIVAGQFGSYGAGTSYETAYKQLAEIKNLTGKDVALTGMDYMMPTGRGEANRYLIDMWYRGMLVTLSWHAPNPFTGSKSTDLTGNNRLSELIDPNTAAGTRWQAALAEIAVSLLALRDAGVPVLWRPFHEMNGGWFWWTPRPDADDNPQPAPFIALWKHMHAYFAACGLDNLLWVYSPNTCDRWRARPNVFYPGDGFVDIVGLDKYRSLSETPLLLNAYGEYDQLVSTGKPVMLCEFGAIPASGAGWDTATYDWSAFIRDLKERYPKIVAFQAWEWVFQIAYKQYTGQRAMMNDPAVVTQDKLPRFDAAPEPQPEPEPPPPAPAALTKADVEGMIAAALAAQKAEIAALLEQYKSETRAAIIDQIKQRIAAL